MNGDLILPEISRRKFFQLKSVLNPKQNQHNWMQKEAIDLGNVSKHPLSSFLSNSRPRSISTFFLLPTGGDLYDTPS